MSRAWRPATSSGTHAGPFGRLIRLTDRMTQATDRLREAAPREYRTRDRLNREHARAKHARLGEVQRLAGLGHGLPEIGRVLDRADPYRYGVPDNRPIRQRVKLPARVPVRRRAKAAR